MPLPQAVGPRRMGQLVVGVSAACLRSRMLCGGELLFPRLRFSEYCRQSFEPAVCYRVRSRILPASEWQVDSKLRGASFSIDAAPRELIVSARVMTRMFGGPFVNVSSAGGNHDD